ncbi:hypothetical protein lerEdw1_013367 [Lerista edwardsae]|nr:hypothetical protein lerEdw1_013370 [Lerista edwardsae]KAJ6650348.1 hypothetical protein lerEdw1_013367 [Lerista edwardsae]
MRINSSSFVEGPHLTSEDFAQSNKWLERQLTAVKGEGFVPANRKGHSAVIYRGSMYVYGGYIDIKGASQEFWTLCLDTKQWSPVPVASCGSSPGPRHGHSAVVYGNGMYFFGGLMGLSEQKDFWKWDFMSANWSNIKRRQVFKWSSSNFSNQGPPKMVGHSALIFEDSMLIFGGGVSNTRPSNILWQYHFPSQIWKKLTSSRETNLSSKAYHCTLGIGCGFQSTADSSSMSLSCLHQKEKRCSRLLAISKQHACFCDYIRPEPTYETFSDEDTCEIEMRTFYQSEEEPGFCLSQTTLSEELSASQAAGILSERRLCLSLSQDDVPALDLAEKEANCLSLDSSESSPVLFLIGGKPLSSPSAISFWQMKLEII